MATGLGFGILIDATIVRSLLLPSLVSLFGKGTGTCPDGPPASFAYPLATGRPGRRRVCPPARVRRHAVMGS
jgi:uncharacterized membrane protein YdfJ with MMPL/SSD domain